jgi:3-methyl-2-oxobutanoate hydroxymethyltransferase
MAKTRTLSLFKRKKQDREKIVMLTAYDLTSALLARDGGVDAILVGDSLGMVVQGHANTLPVSLDDMRYHCRLVTRAVPDLPVIADMPYGTFHVSAQETVAAAIGLMKDTGVAGVKIEGGSKRLPMIEALINAEIPVMGHLGLTPQSIHQLGGYKVQGRAASDADHLLAEARLLQESGCFAIVLECIPTELAGRISGQLTIPTIGIGAGPDCDGQVLVFHDMLGMFDGLRPKFVKRFAELGQLASQAIRDYADDVRSQEFPAEEHVYHQNTSNGVKDYSSTEGAEPPAGEPGYLNTVDSEE